MRHGFSKQNTEKCGTKYGNGNYILRHLKWKWELYFGTKGIEDIIGQRYILETVQNEMRTIFWNGGIYEDHKWCKVMYETADYLKCSIW